MTVIVNKAELARILGVAKPTLDAILDRHPDFPIVQRGGRGVGWQFDAAQATDFLAAHKVAREEDSATKAETLAQTSLDLAETIAAARKSPSPVERIQYARALIAEDQIARERQFLVRTSDMRRLIGPVWLAMSAFLREIPEDLGGRYNLPPDVVRHIADRIAERQRAVEAKLADLLPPEAITSTKAGDLV